VDPRRRRAREETEPVRDDDRARQPDSVGDRRASPRPDQLKLGVNYGWNKVRFPAPVPAGARIRATAEVVDVDDVGGGWWQIVTRFTVEVEGSDKPCCVADSVGRALPE